MSLRSYSSRCSISRFDVLKLVSAVSDQTVSSFELRDAAAGSLTLRDAVVVVGSLELLDAAASSLEIDLVRLSEASHDYKLLNNLNFI